MNRALRLLGAVLLVLGSTNLASGQRGDRASLLLYPEYDTRPGRITVLSVTNTHFSQTIGFERVYVSGADCTEFSLQGTLTPRDNFTFLANAELPALDQGYVYLYALDDLQSAQPIGFDFLIGTATLTDAFAGDRAVEMEPFTFTSPVDLGDPTDLNLNDVRDLNGLEYVKVADELLFPRFLGQGYDMLPGQPGTALLQSDLILINLTGAFQGWAQVDFQVFNDNEENYGAKAVFQCWSRRPLANVSGLFDNVFLRDFTNHAANEVVGLSDLESGWFRIDGQSVTTGVERLIDPAILAVLVTRFGPGVDSASPVYPFQRGEQGNGSLIDRTVPTRDTDIGQPSGDTGFPSSRP